MPPRAQAAGAPPRFVPGGRGGSARARGARSRGGAAGVRWDRLGRIAMLCLLVALAYLYLSAGIRIFSTWRQARSDSALLAALEREHTLLQHQHEALGRRGTVEEEARRLGMMNTGEQSYVV